MAAEADLSRRYASQSADYNPIHLSAATAKLFGFRSTVCHGMAVLGRALPAITACLPADAVSRSRPGEVTVTFRKPVFLPSTVQLRVWRSSASRVAFEISDRGDSVCQYGDVTVGTA